jgi:hypothetical protein
MAREAAGAAVARDPDRFRTALSAIGTAGDSVAQDSVNLALTICTYVLFDIHHGAKPDAGQIQAFAKSFREMEAWAAPDEHSAVLLLSALANREPADRALPPEKLPVIAFLMEAWLLTSFLKGDKHWVDYLDDILDSLEAGSPK